MHQALTFHMGFSQYVQKKLRFCMQNPVLLEPKRSTDIRMFIETLKNIYTKFECNGIFFLLQWSKNTWNRALSIWYILQCLPFTYLSICTWFTAIVLFLNLHFLKNLIHINLLSMSPYSPSTKAILLLYSHYLISYFLGKIPSLMPPVNSMSCKEDPLKTRLGKLSA